VCDEQTWTHRFYTKHNDYLADMANKNILIVVSNSNVFPYSGVLLDILDIVKISKGKARLIWYEDIQNKLLNPIYRYVNSIAELNQKSYEYCKGLESLYSGVLQVEKYKISDHAQELKTNIVMTPDLLKNNNPELFRSIHSDWFGKNIKTLDFNVEGRKENKHFKFDIYRYNLGFELVENYIQNFEILILPNGKYPHQVGMKQAAQQNDKKVFFYEKDNNRTFLQTFQTQDFETLSKSLDNWVSSISDEEKQPLFNWAELWLTKQENNLQQNIFLLNQKDEYSRSRKIRKLYLDNPLKVIPIFTSSLDEKISNLVKDLNGWDSQVEAITLCSDLIDSQGFLPHIRLHPNLERKSVREMIEIFNELEIKNLSYQLPWEGPSTYWHLQNSNSVVTWGATVSLEALANGVAAINLGPSRYKHASGIVTVDRNSIKEINFEKMELPARKQVLLAIYAYKNYGLQNSRAQEFSTFHLNGNNKFKYFVNSYISKAEMLKLFLFDPLKLSSRDFIRILSMLFGRKNAKNFYYYFLKLMALKFKLTKKLDRTFGNAH
jgi:hypothetical protein